MRTTITTSDHLPRRSVIHIDGEAPLLTGKPQRSGSAWTVPMRRVRWYDRAWWRVRSVARATRDRFWAAWDNLADWIREAVREKLERDER